MCHGKVMSVFFRGILFFLFAYLFLNNFFFSTAIAKDPSQAITDAWIHAEINAAKCLILEGSISTDPNETITKDVSATSIQMSESQLITDPVLYINSLVSLILSHSDTLKQADQYLFDIGEAYYLRAEKVLRLGNKTQAQTEYADALAIWENIRAKSTDPNQQANAIYYSGAAFSAMEDYETAVKYFSEVVEKYPNYKKAWYARFRIAQIYETFQVQGKVTKEAIKVAYERLLQNDPNCPAAPIAIQKLNTF